VTLDKPDHISLALWAAGCAEHVLLRFEENRPGDTRPRQAVEAGRAWVRGEMALSEVRAAALAAHGAARATADPAARAAARAAGHAAATAHVTTHAAHAATYAAAAAAYASIEPSVATAKERAWQMRRLPKHLRTLAFPARGDS
jgi:hypothetical protein